MSTDISKTWVYPRVDSDQDIEGKKGLVKAMPLLYGPNYDSINFNPLFTNIRTGALMSKTHHCTYNDRNGHKMTRRCISDCHQAYCIEFIDVVMDGVKYRVRCGARLKVESGGCSYHPANTMTSSKNLMVKNLVAGKLGTISWEKLNDTKDDTAPASAKENLVKEMKDVDINVKSDSFEVQQDDPTAHQPPHIAFTQRKQAQDRAMAEERKVAAAAKRSNAFGKMKQVSDNFLTDKDENFLDKKRRQGISYKADYRKMKPASDKFKNKRGGKNGGKGGS